MQKKVEKSEKFEILGFFGKITEKVRNFNRNVCKNTCLNLGEVNLEFKD